MESKVVIEWLKRSDGEIYGTSKSGYLTNFVKNPNMAKDSGDKL